MWVLVGYISRVITYLSFVNIFLLISVISS